MYMSMHSRGSKKWTISLDGGGWCASVPECEARALGVITIIILRGSIRQMILIILVVAIT